MASDRDPIACPDCGLVEVEHDTFSKDALGETIGISGECPECGERLYYAPLIEEDDRENIAPGDYGYYRTPGAVDN